MGRILTWLFVIGALSVLFGIVALPSMLGVSDEINEEYEDRLAEWHIEWASFTSASDRQASLTELDGIRPPTGSVELLDRHRIYAQAHVIYSQAEQLSESALDIASSAALRSGYEEPLTCGNIGPLAGSPEIDSSEALLFSQAQDACSHLATAGQHLSIVRAQARAGWIEDEIDELRAE